MSVSASLKIDRFDAVEVFMAEQLRQSTVVGAEATAEDARNQIADQIGSGKQYPRLPHQSSAPGEAPVNQFETLHDSIHANLEPDIVGVGASADVDDETGKSLEGGTSRMAPRHFLGPAAVVGEEATKAYVETIPAQLERL